MCHRAGIRSSSTFPAISLGFTSFGEIFFFFFFFAYATVSKSNHRANHIASLWMSLVPVQSRSGLDFEGFSMWHTLFLVLVLENRCVYMGTRIRVCVRACVCVCMRARVCARARACVCARARARVLHTCMRFCVLMNVVCVCVCARAFTFKIRASFTVTTSAIPSPFRLLN